MESRFGHDFSQVRVHTDAKAAQSARAVDARAYTVGRDVVFSEGHYTPHLRQGSKLLAHELAHVIQQERGGPPPVLSSNAPHERAADHAANAAMSGQMHVAVAGATGVGIAATKMTRSAFQKNHPNRQTPEPPQQRQRRQRLQLEEYLRYSKSGRAWPSRGH